jgi:hypothetical protein
MILSQSTRICASPVNSRIANESRRLSLVHFPLPMIACDVARACPLPMIARWSGEVARGVAELLQEEEVKK